MTQHQIIDGSVKRQIAVMAIEERRCAGFVPIHSDLLERCVKAAEGLDKGPDVMDAMWNVLQSGLRAKGAILMPWGVWVKP